VYMLVLQLKAADAAVGSTENPTKRGVIFPPILEMVVVATGITTSNVVVETGDEDVETLTSQSNASTV